MINYVKYLCNNYPQLVEDMKNSKHSYKGSYNKYHMEDSVWSHTSMVSKLGELILEPEYENVKIACLLHDIGKPESREEDHEKGKTTFYGHAGVSFWKSIDILNKMLPEISSESPSIRREDKIEILSLIALHLSFMDIKDNPTKIRHKFKNNQDLLWKLAKLYYCDSNGRFSYEEDYATRKEILDIGNINVIEDTPDSKYKSITLFCGLPCSGKSTLINKIKTHNTTVISRDNLLLLEANTDDYQKAWETVDHNKINTLLEESFIRAVHKRKDIIIDMTNMSKKARNKFTSRVPGEYTKKCVIMATGLEEIKRRNYIRSNENKKHIPNEVLLNMQKSFSLPMYDEFDIIDFVFDK